MRTMIVIAALLALSCGSESGGGGSTDAGAEIGDLGTGVEEVTADMPGEAKGPELPDLVDVPDALGGDLPGDALTEVAEETTADVWVYDYVAPDCEPGPQWTAGTPSFKEVTSEWGLTEMGVLGVRLNITDIDGDGWPDLLARNGGGPDDFGPEGIQMRWVLRNTGEGKFEDVTQACGLFTPRLSEDPNATRPGEVMASGDVDNDGDLDIYVATAIHQPEEGQETIELMLNNGDGTFVLGEADNELRREGEKSVPAGASFVDFDRDGNLDLWTVHNMAAEMDSPLPDALYRGDGTGLFTNVSKDAGIQTMSWMMPDQLNKAWGHSWAWGSAACDLNNDGVPELLAASYGRAPNLLWQGGLEPDGSVKYENASVYSGYAYDHRMDWTDNESARCWCMLHPGDEDCAGVPPPQYIKCEKDEDAFRWWHEGDREPWRLGGNSAVTQCVDVDNDGFMDLMTGEIVHWDVGANSDPAELMFNTGEENVRFVRPGNEITGLVREKPGIAWDHGDMSGVVFDFDNDGWLDVYIGSSDYPHTRGLLFHQEMHRSFVPVPIEDSFEHLRSHGVAVADFDRDGDLDMVVGHSRFRCGGDYLDDCYETQAVRMFENILGNENANWIQFKLEGVEGTNRAAIGARVKVTSGCNSQIRDVDGGHGHFSTQRDLVVHFGVGEAASVDVEIRWPDADLSSQTFSVETNKRYQVVQGTAPAEM